VREQEDKCWLNKSEDAANLLSKRLLMSLEQEWRAMKEERNKKGTPTSPLQLLYRGAIPSASGVNLMTSCLWSANQYRSSVKRWSGVESCVPHSVILSLLSMQNGLYTHRVLDALLMCVCGGVCVWCGRVGGLWTEISDCQCHWKVCYIMMLPP